MGLFRIAIQVGVKATQQLFTFRVKNDVSVPGKVTEVFVYPFHRHVFGHNRAWITIYSEINGFKLHTEAT